MEALALGAMAASFSCQVLQTVQSLHSFLERAKNAGKTFEDLKLETEKLAEQLDLIRSSFSDGRNEHQQWEVDDAIQTSMKLCDITFRALYTSANHLRSKKNFAAQDLMTRYKVRRNCPLDRKSCTPCFKHQGSEPLPIKTHLEDISGHLGLTWHERIGLRKDDGPTNERGLYALPKCLHDSGSTETLVRINVNGKMDWHTTCKARTFPLDKDSNSKFKILTNSTPHREPPLRRFLAFMPNAPQYHRFKSRLGQVQIKRILKDIANLAGEGVVGCALCASALIMSEYGSSHSGPSHQMVGLSRGVSKLKSVIRISLDSSNDWMVLNRQCTSPRLIEAPQMREELYAGKGDVNNNCSFNVTKMVLAATETGPCSPREQLPSFLWGLSSTTFFDAAMIFWIASMAFYLLHRRDKNQNIFVLAGVFPASIRGFVLSWMRRDIGYLTRHVAWALIVSLIGSAIAHRIGRALPVSAKTEDSEYRPEVKQVAQTV